MKHLIRAIGLSICIACAGTTSFSQVKLDRKLKVFFDCESGCDHDFIRSKIKVVDFVLDRLAADVHVLVSSAENGAGGYNCQLIFFGQNDFAHRKDTLHCILQANTTQVEAREMVLRTLQGGLLPYLSFSSYFDQVNIAMHTVEEAKGAAELKTSADDKWNYWVFNAGIDGNMEQDEVYSTRLLKGSFTMNRTTPEQRISFSMSGSNTGSSYKVNYNESPIVYRVSNTDYTFYHSFVSSINNHWSWAYNTSFGSNTFNNIRSRKYFGAGIEYAFFPYTDINTRFFTINYKWEIQNNFYYDSTIFDKMNEFLPGHRLEANLSVKQKWGNISAKLAYTNFLKDHQLNNLNYNLNFDIRISGGLSMYFYSSGALVHDQVYLAKGKASAEDVLTKRRQLKSGYYIYTGVGLNFRFGSMLNNFVNPRFPDN